MCHCRTLPLQPLTAFGGKIHVSSAPAYVYLRADILAAPWRGGRRSLSQSCIYLGPFEIIELTHLSDGERRNAKRSLGEVPAAPAPNLSCLQIAQSLHHNRWDSCLSFLPRSRMFTDVPRTEERTHTSSSCAYHAGRCSHTSHLSQMRQPNRQGCACYTSGDAQIHTFSPFPLSLSSLLSPSVCAFVLSRSDFHVQGQYEPSTGNIAPSNPEHDKRTDAGTLMVPTIIYQQSASLFLI